LLYNVRPRHDQPLIQHHKLIRSHQRDLKRFKKNKEFGKFRDNKP
jgi:hypothetical protein